MSEQTIADALVTVSQQGKPPDGSRNTHTSPVALLRTIAT